MRALWTCIGGCGKRKMYHILHEESAFTMQTMITTYGADNFAYCSMNAGQKSIGILNESGSFAQR